MAIKECPKCKGLKGTMKTDVMAAQQKWVPCDMCRGKGVVTDHPENGMARAMFTGAAAGQFEWYEDNKSVCQVVFIVFPQRAPDGRPIIHKTLKRPLVEIHVIRMAHKAAGYEEKIIRWLMEEDAAVSYIIGGKEHARLWTKLGFAKHGNGYRWTRRYGRRPYNNDMAEKKEAPGEGDKESD